MDESAGLRVVVKKRDARSFFLNGVKPASIAMECEVPRSVSRGNAHKRSGRRRQLPGFSVELVNVDSILPKVGVNNKSILRIDLDHVRVGRIVPADRETAGRGSRCVLRSQGSRVLVHKAR